MNSVILWNLKRYSQASLLNSRGVAEDIIKVLPRGGLCFIILKVYCFSGLVHWLCR